MKRILVLATAVGMLVIAAAAYAATNINTYTAPITFHSKAPGTAKKEVPVTFDQDIKVTPGVSGDRAGVLLKTQTTIYGLKEDGKDFPTCTIAKITAAGNDTVCPKKAAVAKGYISSILGSSTNFSASAPGSNSCDPKLDVWNGGQGKLVFFFVPTAAGTPHACLNGGIMVGTVGPYPATYKQSGNNAVTTVPIPKYIDYPVGGLVGSLVMEHLVWTGQTSDGHISLGSVGCQGKKRPYSTVLTATLPGQPTQNKTVKGTAPCS